ncbi:zinc finger protein 888 [Drosophila obscura]|uniref:zinc finger protein 888 n=1 Tax=Drosophila obscura TaxID=7282 RepID=UPI001BB29F27|nr:zinc finger protein 888 [Drosophila obscura]
MGSVDIKKYRGKCCIPDFEDLLPNRKYRCNRCDKRPPVFNGLDRYNRHLRKFHKIEVKEADCFHCPLEECQYHKHRLNVAPMTKLHMLRRHYQERHLPKKYKCTHCCRRFVLEDQLLKHKCRRVANHYENQHVEIDVESMDDKNSNASSAEETLELPQESMDTEQDRGQRVELPAAKSICPHCDRTLHKKSLKRHLLGCSAEKQCEKCSRKYKHSHNCKEYFCNLCSRTFFRKSDLAKHITTLARNRSSISEYMDFIEDFEQLIHRIESKEVQDEALIKTIADILLYSHERERL